MNIDNFYNVKVGIKLLIYNYLKENIIFGKNVLDCKKQLL